MFQIFINNEEVVCDSNFIIKEEFMNPSSIELYKVYPKSWKGTDKLLTDFYYPDDYSKCKILKDGELYFVGIVKNSANMELNPFKPHYCSLQVLDPSTLLSEGATLDYVISNKTVSEAITQTVQSISKYGFIVGNILIPTEDDTLIGAYSTLNKTAYDVFNYLSMVSGTRWGTRMIDEDTTAVDFYSPELLDNQGIIEYEKDYFKTNKIGQLNYSYSTTDYRNKQIMLSDKVYSDINQQEIKIADGISNIYITDYSIGILLNILVNGESKTITTKAQKEAGVTADFYYTPGENTFESAEIYTYGISIQIEYTPLIKGRQIIYNNNEISRISNNLNREGIISRYENRNDVLSSNELQKVGQSYIKFKGIAEISLNIVSRNDFLILGGKYQFNAPIPKLCGNYLVKSKNTNVYQNNDVLEVYYEYELTNSFDTENELNYFDNQRSKATGNIGEGESITRNIDIENTTNIVFNSLEITEIDSSNILESILESPLNN